MISREDLANKEKKKQSQMMMTLGSEKILDKLSTQKRIVTPNFNMFKPRYRMGQKLPSFMENVGSRLSITGLSYEMLKANNYTEAGFPDSDALVSPILKSGSNSRIEDSKTLSASKKSLALTLGKLGQSRISTQSKKVL